MIISYDAMEFLNIYVAEFYLKSQIGIEFFKMQRCLCKILENFPKIWIYFHIGNGVDRVQ
jgi:hypothetical protein